MTDDINIMLDEREKTHGSYAAQSTCSQYIKEAMRLTAGWGSLSAPHKEALEMIALKIARILYGNPNEPDHWHDITGYARLAEKECK